MKKPINTQFDISACLLFSFARIFDRNIRPKLAGINVKLIIGMSVEISVYSGNIDSAIVGITKAPKIAKNEMIINPNILTSFVGAPDESSESVNRKIDPGIIAKKDKICITRK